MAMAFKIIINATVTGGSAKALADSVDAVAEQLDEIQRHTSAFLGFTLSADRQARTALFSMYVGEAEPEVALAAARSWAVTAITAAGDSTRGWATYAHSEEPERVLV